MGKSKNQIRGLLLTATVSILLLLTVVPIFAATPTISGITPGDGATDVRVDTSIALTINLPNVGAGVDDTTLTSDNVYIYKGSNPADLVPTGNNTSGGFDIIVMTPVDLLEVNTTYTVVVTSGVTDQSGEAFAPEQFSFTTGTDGLPQPSDIQFIRQDLPNTAGFDKFASLDISPDNRLFALGLTGTLHIWDINADGTLTNYESFALGAPRLMIGLVFASDYTSANPSIWVTHNELGFNGATHFTGGLSKFTRSGNSFVETPYIVGLPRSRKDHLTNSLEFGPDGALYVTQGSISAMGDRDNAWGQQPETLLSAAVLRIDLNRLEAYRAANNAPLDVTTGETTNNNLSDAQNYGFGDPELSTTNTDLSDPTKFYNPQLGDASPVTVFASGIRNAYDLTWHTNQELYVPTNGSASGGNAPETPATLPAACANRLDDAFRGEFTDSVPAITNIPTQNDLLFRAIENGYYGHPNPTRCEWVLNGGNPTSGTDLVEVGLYPVGTNPDRNWGGISYNFFNNKSPNGVIEYRSPVFDGQLQGQLLVVRFSGGNDIIALRPDETTLDIPESNATTSIPGFTGFDNPLDLIEDTRNGNIYVSEFGDRNGNMPDGKITLLRPNDIGEALVDATEQLIFSGPNQTPPKDVVLRNVGTAPLQVSSLSITGVDGGSFDFDGGNPGTPVINPGEGISIPITFTPTRGEGTYNAGLRIISNDPATPVYTVSLNGLGTDGNGGNNEPSLQYVLDTFGYGITVGDDDLSTNLIHTDNTLQRNVLGPDEIVQPLFQRAGAGPVTVTPLSAYGPNQNGVTTVVGWYDPTNVAALNPLFTVPGTDSQTLSPAYTGADVFTPPLGQSFGFYSLWPFFSDRVVYSEDRLNTWDDDLHHVRVYPTKLANGTIVPNSFIVATEEHLNGWDYNDIVLRVDNVEPANILGGVLRTENLDWVFPNNVVEVGRFHWDQYLTFQRHQTNDQNPYVHDEVTLRIHNDSTLPGDVLYINGFNFRDNVNDGPGANTPTEFILPNGEDTSVSSGSPIALDPGDSYDLLIRFVYSRNRSANNEQRTAFMDILSSDPSQISKQITLSGAWQERAEQGNEPDVQEIAQYFGFTTVVVGPGQQLNNRGRIEIIGEEVISPFWQRVDETRPLYVRQLAAYHSCCTNSASVFLQPNINGGNTTRILRHNGADGQTLLPRVGSDLGQATIIPPNDAFGFRIDPEWSDPLRNNVGPDDCSGGRDTCGHHVRFWPVRGVDRTLMPDTFLMVMDYSGINYDFNDNVYLISNVKPFGNGENEEEFAFDLELTGNGASDPVDISNDVVYTYEVFNNAFAGAPGVSFELSNINGLTLTNLTSTQGTCAGTSCNIGDMIAEGRVTVTATFSASQLGMVGADATVSAADEFDTTQNTSNLQTMIESGNMATLTIVKEADPQNSQSFTFNGTGGIGTFQITDDGTGNNNNFDVAINFQASGATPTGFDFSDNGDAYGDRGNGLTYGWRSVSNGQAFDGSVNARNRGSGITPENTIMHMRYNECCATGNSGTQTPIYWEIAVPNGEYDVVVALGDSNNDNTTATVHAATAEGITIADGSLSPAPSGGSVAAHTALYPAARVTVTDGALTIDQATNGFNTKIKYITVTGVSTLNNRQTFNVLAGQYDFTEQLLAGWSLDSVTCDGGSSGSITSGVRVSVVAGDDVTCTFANSQTGSVTAPIANPDTASTTAGVAATFNITANDTPSTGRTIDNLTVDLDQTTITIDTSRVIPGEGTFSYDPSTDTMTFTPEIGFVGTSTISYLVEDDTGERSNNADISTTVNPSTACSPLSTLPCTQLVVDYATSGYCAAFDGTGGNIANTGFTMVQTSTNSTDYNTYTGPELADMPAFNPNLVNVTGGQLNLTSTRGIAFRNNSTSSDTNNQVNTLGVGLDVNQAIEITTIIDSPNFGSDNSSQQAGLWFGTDEDNFVKLVVVNAGGTPSRIELRTEAGAISENANQILVNNLSGLGSARIELILVVDPIADEVTASFIVDGGSPQPVGTLPFSGAIIDGVNVDGTNMSFAGVFNTSRRSDTAFTTAFDEFCVFPENNIAPVLTADSTTMNLGEAQAVLDILANDFDPDGTLIQADVDLDPDTSVTITQTVTDPDNNTWVYTPADGLLTFTPAPGFVGTATIIYGVDDDDNTVSQTTATVRVNGGPVTVDDVTATTEDAPVTFNITGNDSDDDGLDLASVDLDDTAPDNQISITNTSGDWLYNPATGEVTFTPATGFTGSATAAYTIADTLGARSEQATLTVSVTPADAAPFHIRVNVGGPELPAADGSQPVWQADTNGSPYPYRSGGPNTFNGDLGIAHPGPIIMTDASIPPAAPQALFNTERWDNGGTINFDIPGFEVGKTYEVRLYFAELFSGVTAGGQRVMQASAEGQTSTAFTDIDPVAQAGPKGGFMRSMEVTMTDTEMNIILGASVENAALKGLEIIEVQPTTMTPPVVTADTATTDENVPVGVQILSNDTDDDGFDLNSLDLDDSTSGDQATVTDASGEWSFDTNTGTLTFTPANAFTGVATINYTIADTLGARSGTAAVEVTVNPAPDTACSPISPLACDQIEVNVSTGVCLPFDGSAGSVSNTGFTMVQNPSFTTYNAAPLPDADVPGWNPALINVAGGQLAMTSTKGIAFRNPPSQNNGDSSANTNTQINTLGLGFDANAPYVLRTTLVNPDFSGSAGSSSQQAGLWFGLDEDNFVKLVLVKRGGGGGTNTQVELRVEENSNSADNVTANLGNMSGGTFELILVVNPTTQEATGSYSIDGAAPVLLGTQPVPASFFSGVSVDATANTMSFGGVFNTHRNAAEAESFTTAFEQFCIEPETPPTIYSVSVDPAITSGAVLPGAPTVVDGQDLTFVVTPDTGFETTTVTVVDGANNPVAFTDNGGGAYTVSAVSGDLTISATFTSTATYTITASATGPGTVTPDNATTYTNGESATYTITPNGGASIVDVLVDGASVGAVTTYEFTNIAADATIEAVFNTPPVANVNNETTEKTVTLNGNAISDDTDADTDALTAVAETITSSQGVSVTMTESGDYSYTPTAIFAALGVGETASDSFTYQLTDGTATVAGTVNITVTGANDLPVANADTATTDEDNTVAGVVVLDNDTDNNLNDTLTVSSVDVTGTLGTATTDGTTVTYDPNAQFEYLAVGESATDTFSYVLTDGYPGSAATSTVTVTINGVNDNPTAADIAVTTTKSAAVTIDIPSNVSDVDTSDSLTVDSFTALTDGTASLISGGTDLSYDPSGAFDDLGEGETQQVIFDYTIADGNGGTATATITVTITGNNDAPTSLVDTGATDEDTATNINVLANDTDPNTNNTLSVESVDTTGTSGTVTNNGTDVTYNPNGQFESLAAGETATDTFTYITADNLGATSTPATVEVTINGVNDAPVTTVADVGVVKDSTLTITPLSNVTDPDTANVLSILSVNTDNLTGTLTDNGDGSYTYNPSPAYDGLGNESQTTSFTYIVTDGTVQVEGTVNINVTGANDLPVAVDDTGSVNADATVTLNLVDNDTDLNNDALSIGTLDLAGIQGAVTDNGDGTITYNPDGNFDSLAGGATATVTFTYFVQDSNNAQSAAAATVTITVNGVNDAPVLADDSITTDQNTVSAMLNLLANDGDPDTGDTLTFVGIDTTGAVGTLNDNGDGTVTYDPNGQFNNLDSGESATATFTYTVQDGTNVQQTANLVVTINGVNDAPVAVADSYTFATGATITVSNPADGVLANDSDPDTNDTPEPRLQTAGTQGGSIVLNADGTFTYTPPAAFLVLGANETASETFTYLVGDGEADSAPVEIVITVNGANQIPVANADNASIDEDNLVIINLLANDTDPNPADVANLAIASVDATSTNGATITNNGDGTVTYDPTSASSIQAFPVGANVTDTFEYTITDGDAASTPATVSVNVTGIDDAPQLVEDANSTDSQTVLNIDAANGLLSNDEDAEGDSFTVINFQATSNLGATVTVDNNGAYTYDPTGSDTLQNLQDGAFVEDEFTYTVTGNITATVRITVRGESVLVPTTVDDSQPGVLAQQQVSIDVLANDTFQGAANINIVSNTNIGIVTVEGNMVTYTAPDTISQNNTTFTYEIVDATGQTSNVATVTIVFNQNGPSFDLIANPMTQTIPRDLDATFDITVINNGNIELTDIDINFEDYFDVCSVDDMTGVISLLPGESRTITCQMLGVVGPDEVTGTGAINITLTGVANDTAVTQAPNAEFRTISQRGAPSYQALNVVVNLVVNVVANQPPTAANDAATVTTGQPADINVLNNDIDPENRLDTNSVRITTAPANGAVAINNGVVNYTSNGGFTGNDALSYEVCDQSAQCASADVAITVSNVPTNDSNDDDSDDANNDNNNADGAVSASAGAATPVTVQQLGLQNPNGNLDWVLAITNNNPTPVTNFVLTQTLPNGVSIINGVSDTGQVQVNGPLATLTIPVLQPGQRLTFTVTTTVMGGQMTATACYTTDGAAEQCVEGVAVTSLPRTGETPWWRNVLIAVFTGLSGLVALRVAALPTTWQAPKQR